MKLSLVFGGVIKLFNVQSRKLHKNEIKTVDKFLAMKHFVFSTYILHLSDIIDSCFMEEMKKIQKHSVLTEFVWYIQSSVYSTILSSIKK